MIPIPAGLLDLDEPIRAALLSFFRSLETPVSSKARRIAVFDFDFTCIQHDIADAVYDWMLIHGDFCEEHPDFWALLPDDRRDDLHAKARPLRGLSPSERIDHPALPAWRKAMLRLYHDILETKGRTAQYTWVVQLMVGRTPEEIRQISRRTIAHELSEPLGWREIHDGPHDTAPLRTLRGIRIHEAIREIIFQLHLREVEVWIVSATNLWTIQAFTRWFGIPASRGLGIRLRLDDAGRLTSELQTPVTSEEGKVAAIQHYIQEHPLLVVGDSFGDLAMLEASKGLRLVVSPRDPAFRSLAHEKGWLLQPQLTLLASS